MRDNEGAVRVADAGRVPLPDEVLGASQGQDRRARQSRKPRPAFQMVVDDIYAISKSRLIGRPR